MSLDLLLSCKKFAQCPDAIRDPRFHRRRHTQGLMNAAEVKVGEVQAVRRPQVLPLLRKGIRQPREATHAHTDRQIRALDMRRANHCGIGVAHDWDLLRVGESGGLYRRRSSSGAWAYTFTSWAKSQRSLNVVVTAEMYGWNPSVLI